jgi:hypothetical protein
MSEDSTSQCNNVGSDSSVSTATRCGLGCPWIESRWVEVFPHPYTTALGPTQSPIQRVLGVLPGELGVTLTTLPNLMHRLKDEKSHTSNPPLGHHGGF